MTLLDARLSDKERMKMGTNCFRVTGVITSLLAVLFSPAVMLVGQAQETYPATSRLTPANSWLNNSEIPNSGEAIVGQTPDRIKFSFSGYANPQRPFPGYVGEWQLGPVNINGSGEFRRSDGELLSGGDITHTDNLRDRRYPNHSTTWKVIKMLDLKSAGGRTELWFQVQVTSSNYLTICPVGTFGVVQLVDDNRQLRNGYAADAIVTQMPSPASRASDGRPACGTHVHGFNNVDYDYTDPPRGGANGGIWAIVEISGQQAASNVSGTWDMVCCSNKYRVKITLIQDGAKISGYFGENGGNSNDGTGGTIEGQINGTTLTFTRRHAIGTQNYVQSYVLTLSRDGRTLTGSYSGDVDTSVGRDVTATRR
jgi:hypothetical protein